MTHSVQSGDFKRIRDGFQFEALCPCGWRRWYMCSEGSPMDLVMATAQRDHDEGSSAMKAAVVAALFRSEGIAVREGDPR